MIPLLTTHSSQISGIEENLSEILRKIRAFRNTYPPVNGLPPEVLARVLTYRDDERDLFAATHVCRYWRSTLTSTPSLWTHLKYGPGYGINRTLTCLKRSKTMTVDIRIDINSLQELDVPRHLAPPISRTRSLVMTGSLCVHAAAFLLCNPAPSLKYLEIGPAEVPSFGLGNLLSQKTPSLHSVTFNGIFLPSLTKLHLYLPEGAGRFYLSSLLRFFSGCLQLQHVFIHLPRTTIQDVVSDRVVVSLESLVEFDYTCNAALRVLPYLKLPRLKRLWACSPLQTGRVNKLADLLPSDGRVFLTGATSIRYFSSNHLEGFEHNNHFEGVGLYGKEISVSIAGFCIGETFVFTDWFSDESCIPFEQIEHLDLKGLSPNTNITLERFKNLTKLRFAAGSRQLSEKVFSLLYPEPGAVIRCPSLREIWCDSCRYPGLLVGSLILLLVEREKEGHRLELVRIFGAEALDRDLEEELKRCVIDLQVRLEESR